MSKALKQTKAGPRSSGTPFLVLFKFVFKHTDFEVKIYAHKVRPISLPTELHIRGFV